MKRFALTFAAVALVATLANSVQAADGYGYGSTHVVDHANLAHSGQHRQTAHYNAHYYPQTGYQHGALHANLNHQATHDQVQHHAAHDYGTYGPAYGGYSGGYNGRYSGRGYNGGYYGNHGINVRTPVGSLWLHH